jgi:peptidoglycan hydrolase CwlO-like protein
MKGFKGFINKKLILFFTLFSFVLFAHAQDKDYPKDGTIETQINHVIDKSPGWENYKSVLTSWLSSLKKNTLDSLNLSKKEIDSQRKSIAEKEAEINNLQERLKDATGKLDEIDTERNTIPFFGINFSKNIFLSTVIVILLILIALISILFWLYKHSFTVIRKTQEELEKTSKEFEEHRQDSRKKYEQLVIQHHKELQKFRGL